MTATTIATNKMEAVAPGSLGYDAGHFARTVPDRLPFVSDVKLIGVIGLALMLIAAMFPSVPAETSQPAEAVGLSSVADQTTAMLLDPPTPTQAAINSILLDAPALKRQIGDVPEVAMSDDGVSFTLRVADALGSDSVALALTRAGSISAVPATTGHRVELVGAEASVVAEGNADGLRVFETIPTADAAHQFNYTAAINGEAMSFLVQETGAVLVGQGTEADFIAGGAIDAPWAFDAKGRSVPVSYSVSEDGTNLTLTVTPGLDVAYPIVADPEWRTWAGMVHCSWSSCTFYLERARTYRLAWFFNNRSWNIATAAVVNIVCGAIGAVVSAVGTPLLGFGAGVACGTILAAYLWDMAYHSRRGYACMTINKPHWRSWPSINHVSGYHRYCHYNV